MAKIQWTEISRAYSLPMSVMSFSVPFLFALFDGGNVVFGLIALIGIVFAHLGVNMFDDYADYRLAKKFYNGKIPADAIFQKGKCAYLFDGTISENTLFLAVVVCFTLALICGVYLGIQTGMTVFYIMLIAGVLGLLYPFLTYVALGEITVGIMFSPLLYIGVYYVMTQSFSKELIPLAISTGLLTVGLLHAHMFLDFDFDKKNRKITLCSLAGSKNNAVKTQAFIFFFAFANIVFQCCMGLIFGSLSPFYLLCLLSIPTAYVMIDLMSKDSTENKEEIKPNIFYGFLGNLDLYEKLGNKYFMIKFMVARNVMVEFTFFVCVAKVLSELV